MSSTHSAAVTLLRRVADPSSGFRGRVRQGDVGDSHGPTAAGATVKRQSTVASFPSAAGEQKDQVGPPRPLEARGACQKEKPEGARNSPQIFAWRSTRPED